MLASTPPPESRHDAHHPCLRTLARSRAGLAQDMRVRWALEEVGQAYDVRLVSLAAMKQPLRLTRNGRAFS